MPVTKDDVDEIRELIAREIRDVIKGASSFEALLESAEANYREAQARVVEKTDPARADRIRKIKPEF
jgi:hypothetical protein